MAHDRVPGSFEWAFIVSKGEQGAPYRLGPMPLVGRRPCCAGQSPVSSAPGSSMRAGTRGKDMKILIADDHRLVIEAVKAKLSELEPGIEFVLAMSVDELLAGATDDLDLALIDLNMPGADGQAHIDVIRQRHPAVPVMVLSGYEDPAIMRSALERGVLGFMVRLALVTGVIGFAFVQLRPGPDPDEIWLVMALVSFIALVFAAAAPAAAAVLPAADAQDVVDEGLDLRGIAARRQIDQVDFLRLQLHLRQHRQQ
eukprot:gene38021-51349_t